MIKVIPVHLEVELKNPEQPLKVQYVIELTTEVYSDIMGTGVTYLADPDVTKTVEMLVNQIQQKINMDLGILSSVPDTNTNNQEEDL